MGGSGTLCRRVWQLMSERGDGRVDGLDCIETPTIVPVCRGGEEPAYYTGWNDSMVRLGLWGCGQLGFNHYQDSVKLWRVF